MTSPHDPARWPQSALVKIAKVSEPTFTSWRKRHGLLPQNVKKGQWKYYSTAEICVARTMVVLVNNGVQAEKAAKLAMQTMQFFHRVCEVDGGGMIENNIYIFFDDEVRIADPTEGLEALTRGDEKIGECGILLNLALIVLHVMVGLHNQRGANLKLEGGPPAKAHETFAGDGNDAG